jgi:hypothetical protein
MLTDVSEEHIASIFRVEELAEQEISVKVSICFHAGFMFGRCDNLSSCLSSNAIQR